MFFICSLLNGKGECIIPDALCNRKNILHNLISKVKKIQINERNFNNIISEVRKEAETHRMTMSMSPAFKSTTTTTFSLTDPILPNGFENEKDPTQEWFNIHSK